MDYWDSRIEPYLPSLQPSWTKTFSKSLYDYRAFVPHATFTSLDEFNWYNGNKPRFRHPYALYSAGHAELDLDKARKVDAILFDRDRSNTFLLADSGGFQVGRGNWPLSSINSQIRKVISWQEEIADLAVILEVPTWLEQEGESIGFDQALAVTKRNLKAYANYSRDKIKFLNPLHGLSYDEGRRWFDETRWFNDQGYAVGWCFASAFSKDLHLALKMVLYMIEQEHYPRYLHFLGEGGPASALVAGIMRRTISRAYPQHLREGPANALNVTIDASSEFLSIGRYMTIYERALDVEAGQGKTNAYQIKTSLFDSADRSKFPANRTYPDVEGPILGRHAKGVVFGDILAPVSSTTTSQYNLDDVSRAVLIAHNIWVKLDTIRRMGQLESALRRIDYAKKEMATQDFADMISRLVHTSTAKGKIGNLGEDLIACTVGLWATFKDYQPEDSPEPISTYRRHRLDEFEKEATSLFGKTTATPPEA